MLFAKHNEYKRRLDICRACKFFESSTQSCGPLIVGEEVETEVVRRIDQMISLMKIEPKLKSSGVDPNSRLGKLMGLDKLDLTAENPFLIKEYAEGYVEKMLQKSISPNHFGLQKYTPQRNK